MKNTTIARVLCLLLCLCLLPVGVLGEETEAADDSAVTRSDFSLSLNLHADGFPQDAAAHYEDWETFLNKLSLRGTIDTQRFLQPFSRVYFDGGLYLEDKQTIPFEYDGYYSFRYIRSPALAGASVHFQMHNFFEFMLKPYYFMELPTPLIALFMYPEASYYMGESYYTPIAELCAGEGERTIEYAELYELCETLDMLVYDNMDFDRVYYYITSLLIGINASDMTLDSLSYLESWLDYLDPEQNGLSITPKGDTETWVIGNTTLFEKKERDGAVRFTLHLPNAEGYELNMTYAWQPHETGVSLTSRLSAVVDGQEDVWLSLEADGLPNENQTDAQGHVIFTIGGNAVGGEAVANRFNFRYSRDAQEMPYNMALYAEWLHPKTDKPAMSFTYSAAMEMQDETVLVDRPYDNQDDFFHLNESFMEEYKERFTPSLVLAFAPILLEMPTGVINDTVSFLDETGFLMFFGIE